MTEEREKNKTALWSREIRAREMRCSARAGHLTVLALLGALSSLGGCVLMHGFGHTVDGCEIHFAPPEKPWNL